jgi:hypothetical protein
VTSLNQLFSSISSCIFVQSQLVEDLISCIGQAEHKQVRNKYVFTSSMALRRSNFAAAQARCDHVFTSRRRRFDKF